MLTIYILLFLIFLWGFSFCRTGFNAGYIGKEQSNAVRGIFIVFVFVRHIMQYMQRAGYDLSYWGDTLYLRIDKSLGQLIVVMFLFYSGYGVMESIKKKGNAYIDSMPQKRILKTLCNFDIAVVFFIIARLLLGHELDITKTLLAFTGWVSIKNSNWYIFVILLCYTAVWVSFKYAKWWMSIILIFILFVSLRLTKEIWWYNTILSFPAGLIYSKFKPGIEKYLQSKYWLALFVSLITFLFLYKLPIEAFGLRDNMMSIAFAMTFVLLTMKMKFGNKILDWLGKNLFPLYIYQRIPMFVFAEIFGGVLISDYTVCYVLLCAAVTLLFARIYKYISI